MEVSNHMQFLCHIGSRCPLRKMLGGSQKGTGRFAGRNVLSLAENGLPFPRYAITYWQYWYSKTDTVVKYCVHHRLARLATRPLSSLR